MWAKRQNQTLACGRVPHTYSFAHIHLLMRLSTELSIEQRPMTFANVLENGLRTGMDKLLKSLVLCVVCVERCNF